MSELDTDTWNSLKALFHRAAETDTREREAILAELHAEQPGLARQLERMLAADSDSAASNEAGPSLVGRRAGPWELSRRVGLGATSEVYLAARVDESGQHPELPATAAVKVLHAELASREVLRRFELEQRTLASLRHPNVVGVLGAETLDDGRPCLVMEAAEGEHLDVAAARCRSPREVLALFLQLCAAVRHAHEHLVVHRDLKPGNVCVQADGRLKVLDFGVAKLLAPRLGDVATQPGWIAPLTPRYASPEQWDGGAISTKSDVFSLGVLLAELLARFELAPGSDLDLIARRAAAREASERYPSVESLAEDLERHLSGLPVRARRPSRLHAAARFALRHRLGVAAGALVVLLLTLGLLFVNEQWRRAQAAELLAWRAHAQALSVAGLYEDLLDSTRLESLADDPGFLKALDTAAAQVATRFADLPEAEGRARASIAQLYLRLERADEALPHALRAQALAETSVGFDRNDRAAMRALVERARSAGADSP